MTVYIALLRGINVSGRNKLPMADLRTLVIDAGGTEVRTYIQSGNVVFRATKADARAIEERIRDVFGFEVTVVLRTGPELAAAAAHNPFLVRGAETKPLYVVFLDREAAADAVHQLDPDRSPGDHFSVHGREVYLDLPTGAGRTKLNLDYLERRLKVKGTARNWNTVLKLVDLTG